MKMTNAEWMIKQGYKFSDLDAVCLGLDRGCKIRINGKTVARVPHVDRTNAIICWLDEEHKEPILDDAEKRYLSAVIRPFKNRVDWILKVRGDVVRRYFIEICIITNGSDEYIFLPYFDGSEMYKGMKVDRRYTPEELGL